MSKQAIYQDCSEFVKVRLLGGAVTCIKRDNLVGYCHNMIHPGLVSKGILKEHECLKKDCPFLQRFEKSPFWSGVKRQEKDKMKSKNRRKAKKDELLAKKKTLDKLRMIANDTNSNIDVIRFAFPDSHTCQIFFVSDNNFDDGDHHGDFVELAGKELRYPRICMKHIKNIDGTYVTREEYLARKKW